MIMYAFGVHLRAKACKHQWHEEEHVILCYFSVFSYCSHVRREEKPRKRAHSMVEGFTKSFFCATVKYCLPSECDSEQHNSTSPLMLTYERPESHTFRQCLPSWSTRGSHCATLARLALNTEWSGIVKNDIREALKLFIIRDVA
jgi:hypothetical protein